MDSSRPFVFAQIYNPKYYEEKMNQFDFPKLIEELDGDSATMDLKDKIAKRENVQEFSSLVSNLSGLLTTDHLVNIGVGVFIR